MTAVAVTPTRLELWAGVECTVNRTHERWSDQLERSGHASRLDDLDRLAALGVRTVRYPLLWERTVRHAGGEPDWRWSDARLGRLRSLGIRPVVGLVHHGSGPSGTDLTDPRFPERLAGFARAVAERYPWVDAYTPVNEPLTTARFSGLYGHWYPHARGDRAWARMLLNQIRATVLAMRAVRAVDPGARLVQTEDLGQTHATPPLSYQAAFENARRWATWDLLCGRVDEAHPLWRYLRSLLGSAVQLEELVRDPCPPDIVGINHYLTSERFLDDRLERYPAALRGGNGRDRYVDVEAVRVEGCHVAGPRALIEATWRRYRLPVVVTEVHLGCTREQQLRWLDEVWEAAGAVRSDGADVRAVTLWSAFGAFDWSSLLTREDGHYEPGAYDVRAPRPRPTALARMARDLATAGSHDHPVLDLHGWWRCDGRVLHGTPAVREFLQPRRPRPRALVVTGARGTLGRAFAIVCAERGLAVRALDRAALDITDPAAVAAVLDDPAVWGVVNCAGYVRVDDAEWDESACWRANRDGPAVLARACAQRGMALATFSSDLVFDGARDAPYVESDAPDPLCVYGASKVAAERAVLEPYPAALVVRTSAFFGPWDEYNFVTCALRAMAAGDSVAAADDLVVSPTYVPDLAHATLDLLIDGESGVWHLANVGAVTWAELARRAAAVAGLDPALVDELPAATLGHAARRPRQSALASERAAIMPALDDALARYAAALALPRKPVTAPVPL